jgi:flagellar protein FliS
MTASHKMYSEIGLSTDLMNASAHKQIQLLLDKCLSHMQTISTSIQTKEYSKKHQAVAKTLDILKYLRICLNFKDEKTNELSKLLDSLYAYIEKHVLEANLKNNIEYVTHAKGVLTTIKEGWDGIV